MTSPFFSVIIPTYNSAACVRNALNSILSQTFRGYEILIIDSVSSDGTVDIIKEYMQKNDCVRLISEKDNGIYDAMNKGIFMARGEWLYFMGSDDAFINEAVLKSISENITENTELVYGNVIWVPSRIKEEGMWEYARFLKGNINHQRIFYNARLFREFGNFNIRYGIEADHELNIRFFCNDAIIKKYVNVDVALYNETGFSANKKDEEFWNNWRNTVLRPFSKHIPQKEIYRSLGWYCWKNLRLKKYRKALSLFWLIFSHTGDISFLKHTLSQASKLVRR